MGKNVRFGPEIELTLKMYDPKTGNGILSQI